MFRKIKAGMIALLCGALLLGSGLMSRSAQAVELQMYYAVGVGGPLTKIMDGLVADFEEENPGITVKAGYAGSYTDTTTKAMTALRGGQPPQLSVILSADLYELIDQDAVVPIEDLARTMTDLRIRHVPVVVDGKLHAIVSIGDIVKHRIDELQSEREQLVAYIQQ